jgi:glycosyltransferase involved in cell wall biosynthesis
VGYDFEIVLKAAHLLREHKDIEFVIRGMGEREREIRKMTEKLELANVRIDTRYLSRQELLSVLSSADVFLLPMKQANAVDEGLPTKVFEYEVLGKPIICSSKGEPAAYIRSVKSGLVVDPGDHEGLAAAILKLYRDRKLASELGANGYRSIHKSLTSEKIGDRLYAVFASAMQL